MFLCQSGHSVENRYGKTNEEATAVTQKRYWGGWSEWWLWRWQGERENLKVELIVCADELDMGGGEIKKREQSQG